jgi:hypothetical protein
MSASLAQSVLDPKIWLYFLLLIVVLTIGAIVIFSIRRKLFARDETDTIGSGGGLMDQLDEMRKSGKITQEEYDQTRKAIIQKAVERMNDKANQQDKDANPTPPDHLN